MKASSVLCMAASFSVASLTSGAVAAVAFSKLDFNLSVDTIYVVLRDGKGARAGMALPCVRGRPFAVAH